MVLIGQKIKYFIFYPPYSIPEAYFNKWIGFILSVHCAGICIVKECQKDDSLCWNLYCQRTPKRLNTCVPETELHIFCINLVSGGYLRTFYTVHTLYKMANSSKNDYDRHLKNYPGCWHVEWLLLAQILICFQPYSLQCSANHVIIL